MGFRSWVGVFSLTFEVRNRSAEAAAKVRELERLGDVAGMRLAAAKVTIPTVLQLMRDIQVDLKHIKQVVQYVEWWCSKFFFSLGGGKRGS